MGDEILAGLQDPSDKVRIAAAHVCFQTMEAQRSSRVRELQQRNSFSGSYQGTTTLAEGTMILDASDTVTPVSPPSSFLGGIADLFTKSGAQAKPAAETKPAESKPSANAGTLVLTGSNASPRTIQGAVDAKGKPAEAKPVEEAKVVVEDPYELWLTEYYAGKRRPAWTAALIGPLEKMLQAGSADERLMAAVTLVPLGKARTVLPTLYEVAQSDPKKYREVLEVLPWLVWEQRLAAFRQLRKIAPTPEAVSALVESLAEVHDPRAADLLWDLLADAKTTDNQAGAIEQGLLSLYGIDRWYSFGSDDQSAATKQSLRELARLAKPRVASGSDRQRLVALGLLTYADPAEAAAAAEKLQADTAVSAALRTDAFQILLALSLPKEGARAAAAGLSGKDPARQTLALQYFVYGGNALSSVRRHERFHPIGGIFEPHERRTVVPKPPEGLHVSQLLRLLDDPQPAVAAEAGYLLALLGESRGLEPLLRYAQQQGKSNSQLQRLAYRAIAALDDSNQIPLLKKIYAGLSQYEVSEFYWTIRIMTGPEILKFRKQIRDEVGINQLQ